MKRSSSILLFLLVLALVVMIPAGATDYTIYAKHDADMYNTTTQTWQQHRDSIKANTATDNTTTAGTATLCYLKNGTAANSYVESDTSGWVFDTSVIDDGETVTSATVTFKSAGSKTVTLGGKNNISIVVGTPTNPLDFVTGDYGNWNHASPTELAPEYNFTATATNANIVFTFYSGTLFSISKTSYTTIYTLDSDLVLNSFSGDNPTSGGMRRISAYDAASGADAPYMTIHTTSATPPVAAFSATPTFGLHPVVVFTDASTNTPISWSWDFGDGDSTNSTQPNPVHHYLTNGTYTVTLTATNAGGSDDEVKTKYIYSYGVAHPITLHLASSPGYIDNATPTKASNFTALVSYVNTHLTTDYTPYFGTYYYENSLQNIALYFGYAFQLTGDTRYVNKSVDLMRNISPVTCNEYMGYFTSSTGDAGDWGMAYDLIHPAYGMGTTLDGNNTLIRDKLAIYADQCYGSLNTTSPLISYHEPVLRAWVASLGWVLADYTNSSMTSTPAMWQQMGGDDLWIHDPWHNYNLMSYTKENNGLAVINFNPYSGGNEVGRYTSNYPVAMARWANEWSTITGQNYLTVYPHARLAALSHVWQIDPMGWKDNVGTEDTNWETEEIVPWMNLMNVSDRAAAEWAIERSVKSPYYYGTLNNHVAHERLARVGYADYYFYYPNLSAVTAAPPAYTSNFERNGSFFTLRSGWSPNDTWFRVSAHPDPLPFSNDRFNGHADQMAWQIMAYGDRLSSDAGEYNTRTTGLGGIGHNTILLDNGTPPFPVTHGLDGNTSYIGATRGIPNSSTYTGELPGLIEGPFIHTPAMEVIGFLSRNQSFSLISATTNDYFNGFYPPSPVNQSRTYLYPLKEYIIVIDRMKSDREYGYYDKIGLTSYNIEPNTSVSLDSSQLFYGVQTANGTLDIGTTRQPWVANNISVENVTGITTNNITWQTTNQWNQHPVLNIFTSPAAPVSVINYVFDMNYGVNGGTELTKAPNVLFKQPMNKTMYRVMALFTRLNTDAAKVPSELTVTGTGSAIKVVNGAITDTIYTGLGTSTANGYTTDAETLFVRKGAVISDYTLLNATTLSDGGSPVFTSTARLDYIARNRTASGINTVNVSGPSGSTDLKFYGLTGSPTYVTIDDTAAGSWSYAGSTLTITTTLSDHNIQFDEGGVTPTPTTSTKPWWLLIFGETYPAASAIS